MYMSRAVDNEGGGLEILVESKRDKAAHAAVYNMQRHLICRLSGVGAY